MKESKNNTILNQYLRAERSKGFYCYYELKVARGDRFSFSSIEEVQEEGLPALAKDGLVWKLSDEDSRRKPCDGFSAPPMPSYLVVRFKDTFYFIDHAEIVKKRLQGYKSMNEAEARLLSTRIVHQ
jgi:hypothetical protein